MASYYKNSYNDRRYPVYACNLEIGVIITYSGAIVVSYNYYYWYRMSSEPSENDNDGPRRSGAVRFAEVSLLVMT